MYSHNMIRFISRKNKNNNVDRYRFDFSLQHEKF